MTPERAIAEVAWAALEEMHRGREHGFDGSPERLLLILSAVSSALLPIAAALDAEVSSPGMVASMLEEDRERLIKECEAAAMGMAIVYAHAPGIDRREPRGTH